VPEELRVRRSLVDRAARLRDEARIAEVTLKRFVVGTEGTGSADPSEGDNVRVIGLAQPGSGDLGLLAPERSCDTPAGR
jgi:hypothetical protein